MKKILGYADRWSVVPGATVSFKVSTYGPDRYRADLVRVICGDDDPDHGIFDEEEIAAPFNGEYKGRLQPIDAGSYAIVDDCQALDDLSSFTLQAWVFPTTPAKGEQGLITKWLDDPARGFALLIDAKGAACFRVADGAGTISSVSAGKPLTERRWYLVTASYDAETGKIWVSQSPTQQSLEVLTPASAAHTPAGFAPVDGPLVFAAIAAALPNGKPGSRAHFNGKIDRPRILAGALGQQEKAAIEQDPVAASMGGEVFAAWDFSRDIGSARITDTSEKGLHGRTVNLPSRGCKGFNWSGDEQNWRYAPEEYGAIHFHDDDLYDAGWESDFDYVIPDTLRSGIYAVRLRAEEDESYITFFVRPPKGQTTSKLAFLVSTVTYMAYSNYHWLFHQRYAEATESLWTTMEKTDVFLQEHNELGLSTYDTHSDGSGVRYASRLRPVLNMAPKTPLWSFNPDTHITGWLENQGFDYDIITDEDLHSEGAELLESYRAVITGTHPEYYTTPMLEGLRSYIAGAGRLIYLGGNGFIWRCALSDEFPGILELRRAEDGIRYRDEEPGEYYLEFTGEYGGLWRRLGIPPQALVGVGTIAVGFDAAGYYKRKQASFDPRATFIFEGIGNDETIGDFGYLGGGASGSEIDYIDPMMGTPKHALVVASSEGHSENTLIVPDEIGFHHIAMNGSLNPDVRADMTFFETPGGGAVFSVGSITWGASLPHNGYDNNVSRLTGNVLKRFLAEENFQAPE